MRIYLTFAAACLITAIALALAAPAFSQGTIVTGTGVTVTHSGQTAPRLPQCPDGSPIRPGNHCPGDIEIAFPTCVQREVIVTANGRKHTTLVPVCQPLPTGAAAGGCVWSRDAHGNDTADCGP